jgi:hypothetical protein
MRILAMSAGSEAGYRSMKPEDVRKVLLTFLGWAPDDWIGKARLLQSEYWTEDELAQIHNALMAGNEAGSEELAVLIEDEILRRLALHNIDDVYNKGAFANLSGPIFPSDIYGAFMRGTLRDVNSRFLITSPGWRQMKDYVSPELYARAQKGVNELFASAKPLASGFGPLLYDLQAQLMDETSVSSYFDGLGDHDAQEKYISGPQGSLPELAHILQFPTDFTDDILTRLMKTIEGRILVLQAYLRSNDSHLLGMVEGRDWVDVLQTDVALMPDPVSVDIFRRSMEKSGL